MDVLQRMQDNASVAVDSSRTFLLALVYRKDVTMKTVIYGAGSTARMAAALLGDQLGGVVADYPKRNAWLGGHTVVDSSLLTVEFKPDKFNLLICIGYQHGGMNMKRKQLFETLSMAGYNFEKAIDFTFRWPVPLVVGDGCLLLDGVTMHDNAQVGTNCFVSSGTVIGHDAQIGNHSWINANVSIDGGAVVGEQCVIGAGAVIGAGVELGARTLIGPGAVVLRDTEPDSVWLAPGAVLHRFNSNVFGRMQA